MKVADVAMAPLTVICLFFSAFFNADLVMAATKIPTPYSCSRIGEGIFGTICVSTDSIVFFVYGFSIA
jgi:hypothetical protein